MDRVEKRLSAIESKLAHICRYLESKMIKVDELLESLSDRADEIERELLELDNIVDNINV